MAVREILRMGHPLLRQKSREMTLDEISSEETLKLIDDMYETMQANEGIGLAAPQIGELIQLAIIGVPEAAPGQGPTSSRYSQELLESMQLPSFKGHKLLTVINPKISYLTKDTQFFWEGCLSVPGLRGEVQRPKHIKVRFFDQQANEHEIEVQGFMATVFQHEIDHLHGVIYIDRIQDKTKLAFNEEYLKFWVEPPN